MTDFTALAQIQITNAEIEAGTYDPGNLSDADILALVKRYYLNALDGMRDRWMSALFAKHTSGATVIEQLTQAIMLVVNGLHGKHVVLQTADVDEVAFITNEANACGMTMSALAEEYHLKAQKFYGRLVAVQATHRAQKPIIEGAADLDTLEQWGINANAFVDGEIAALAA